MFTPTQRLRAAVLASHQPRPTKPVRAARPEPAPVEHPRREQVLQQHTSEGVTRAYLLSREKSLLRELATTSAELDAVQKQLATYAP